MPKVSRTHRLKEEVLERLIELSMIHVKSQTAIIETLILSEQAESIIAHSRPGEKKPT